MRTSECRRNFVETENTDRQEKSNFDENHSCNVDMIIV